VFRYNNRNTKKNPLNDADRFDAVLRNLVGKRITYKELTGKEGETTPFVSGLSPVWPNWFWSFLLRFQFRFDFRVRN
jgi:hypothetical protein